MRLYEILGPDALDGLNLYPGMLDSEKFKAIGEVSKRLIGAPLPPGFNSTAAIREAIDDHLFNIEDATETRKDLSAQLYMDQFPPSHFKEILESSKLRKESQGEDLERAIAGLPAGWYPYVGTDSDGYPAPSRVRHWNGTTWTDDEPPV